MPFVQAKKARKRKKIMLWGPPGCHKTRTMLRLGHVEDEDNPKLAVMDVEFGTDWFREEFNFKVCEFEKKERYRA